MATHRRAFLKGLAALGACPLCAGRAMADDTHPHWSYEGEFGPEDWDELDPEYRVCETGSYQSPIDIADPIVAEIPPIEAAWAAASVAIVNNGHTIQVDVPPGTTTTVGPRRLDLVQFHFHAPSEHLVAGKASPMEAHFVHRDAAGAGLGVLGVFLVRGARNPAFARIAEAFPAAAGAEAALADLDLAALLPSRLAYWTYAGSLTTPPCSEIVRWMVAMVPVEAAAEDIARFAALCPNSARPVAAIDRRFVLASE